MRQTIVEGTLSTGGGDITESHKYCKSSHKLQQFMESQQIPVSRIVDTIVARSGHRLNDVNYSAQIYGLVDEVDLTKSTTPLRNVEDDVKFCRYRMFTQRDMSHITQIWSTPYYSVVPNENLVVMYGPCLFYEMREKSYTKFVREVRRQIYLHGGTYGIVTRNTIDKELDLFKQLVREENAYIESNPEHTYHEFKRKCLDKWIFEHQTMLISVIANSQNFEEFLDVSSTTSEQGCPICLSPSADNYESCTGCGVGICSGCRLSIGSCPYCRVGSYG